MESSQLPPSLDGLSPAGLLARALDPPVSPAPDLWEPPPAGELQRLLPEYSIDALIGRGGMGAVYKGVRNATRQTVAIKLLPAELAKVPRFANRFNREAQILTTLDHPGIVRLFETGNTPEGHPYFVTEYVDGMNLHQAIHQQTLDVPRILDITAQICTALRFAHSRGIIHRDIKPANILLTHDGRVKLCDFGLARPLSGWHSAGFTLTRTMMGTPDYMAPEQKRGEGDHRIDLFSLGITLYEMLCGKTPQGAWKLPSQLARIDPRIDSIVVKALQEAPQDRYQQAEEMLADLDRLRLPPLSKARSSSRRKISAIFYSATGIAAFAAVFHIASGPPAPLATAHPAAPTIPPPLPPPDSPSWQDVFGSHRPLRPHHTPNSEGWIVVPSSHPQVQFVTVGSDKGIARLKVMWKSGTTAFQCALGQGRTDYTALDIGPDGIRFNRKPVISKPIRDGDTFTIHLSWIGNQIRIWVDGEFAGIRHARKPPAYLTMRGNVHHPAVPEEVWIRDVQWMNLADLSDLDALNAIHGIISPP